jgi:hypothetical protein
MKALENWFVSLVTLVSGGLLSYLLVLGAIVIWTREAGRPTQWVAVLFALGVVITVIVVAKILFGGIITMSQDTENNSGTTATRKKRRWLAWSIVFVGLGAIGLGIAAASNYSLSDKDKAEANRLMVAWAADGEEIPGWTDKSPIVAEVRKTKTIHVVYETSIHSENKPDTTGPHIPTFTDPRIRVVVKRLGERVGQEGDRSTDVTFLIGESRDWAPDWRTYLTIVMPTATKEETSELLKIECTWKKRLWGLRASVRIYVHAPVLGWIEAGKK